MYCSSFLKKKVIDKLFRVKTSVPGNGNYSSKIYVKSWQYFIFCLAESWNKNKSHTLPHTDILPHLNQIGTKQLSRLQPFQATNRAWKGLYNVFQAKVSKFHLITTYYINCILNQNIMSYIFSDLSVYLFILIMGICFLASLDKNNGEEVKDTNVMLK